jgi:hypothetical protein
MCKIKSYFQSRKKLELSLLVDYIYYLNQRASLRIHKNCKSFEVFFSLKLSNDKKLNLDLQIIEPMTST